MTADSTPWISGVGLHSGTPCRLRAHVDGDPAAPVTFLAEGEPIPATIASVVSTSRCTTLGVGEARISMVEHFAAACAATGHWRGVIVEVEGPELPALDGSAAPWIEVLDSLERHSPPAPHLLANPVRVDHDGAFVAAAPGPIGWDVEVEFPHPAIGRQRWVGGPADLEEVWSARTPGFLSEARKLRSRGLALGAGVENAQVYTAERALQRPRGGVDEPVRHKVLDLIGDLWLLGRPLQATVTARRSSHRLHIELSRVLMLEP